jgi:hypothetical protein
MQGYVDTVTHLHQQVSDGLMSPAVATAEAKQQLCQRVHTAVLTSIGYKQPLGRQPRARFPPVYTAEVRAAVCNRRACSAQVAAVMREASNTAELPAAQAALHSAQVAVKDAVKAARANLQATAVDAVYECASRRDAKGMWRALKTLGGGKAHQGSGPTALKTNDGRLVMGDQQIADCLAAQFKSATDSASYAQGAGFDEHHKETIEAEVMQYRMHTSHTEEGPEGLSGPVTACEVAAQCCRMKNWKAPSPLDGIHYELLKYGGKFMLQALTALLDMQFQLETKAQTAGVIRALYKREDPTEAANYRPITLGSAVDKLYNSVLNTRICDYLEEHAKLHDSQHGFRPGRSAVDNLFMLNQSLSARMHAKLDTYLLFLDIQKAYDSVWRAGLLWHVWNKGIQGKLFRVLAQMTDSPSSMVLHNGAYSAPFQPDMGWEQGDTLATTMFNIHVDAVLQEVWEHHEGVHVPAPRMGDEAKKLAALMYADDLAAIAATEESMHHLVNIVRAALTKWRLKASVKSTDGSKTAIMVIRGGARAQRVRAAAQGPATSGNWRWGDISIPQVRHYKYLGVWVSDAGTWDLHMQQRLQKADAAAHANATVLRAVGLPWHMRKITMVAVVQPVLTYACQVWNTTTKAMRDKLDGWQGTLLKGMTHCPPTTSTQSLRYELGILPLHMACDMWLLSYWYHLQNVSSDRLLHSVFSAWSGAQNPWLKNVNRLLAEYDIDADLVQEMTRGQFVEMVRKQITAKATDGNVYRGQASGGNREYTEAYGTGLVKHHKPAPRAYITALSAQRRGAAAEVCMRLRVGALQLKAMQTYQRRGETAAARKERELCPCCCSAAETPFHFVFECTAYAACREKMMVMLQEMIPNRLTAIAAARPQDSWRMLLGAGVLDAAPARQQLEAIKTPLEVVADFVMEAWKHRNTVLTGRGTNGGNPMV